MKKITIDFTARLIDYFPANTQIAELERIVEQIKRTLARGLSDEAVITISHESVKVEEFTL